MRLWSIHPRYLDAAGLVALWREGLLAQAVLSGLTRGYTKHPQLLRFREQADPRAAIAVYLHAVADEADRRAYSFDRAKLPPPREVRVIEVADGQLLFEWQHLAAKLRERDARLFRAMPRTPSPHPSFVVVPGDVASWERR
jgi:hypothetical protein